jgi:DNA repair protein RecO (recombination protein O)
VTRRIDGETAYVLHARPYRETSSIVDLLTLRHGRLSVVVKGARGRRGTRVQPFGRLLVRCSGRGALLTLVGCESLSHRWLAGDALYAGLYLNELLLRLLRDDDPHPRVFEGYERALEALTAGVDVEPVLRVFERLLLKECGYELTLAITADSGTPVEPTAAYRFVPDSGFHGVAEPIDERLVYAGATLLAIDADDYADPRARRAAKYIMRRALAPHLGDRPIKSRALYRTDKPQ